MLDFSDIDIGREAFFQQAVFSITSTFDRAKLSGGAFLRAARFVGGATFVNSQISRQADFQKVVFGSDCDFSQMVVGGYLIFRSAAFTGNAFFNSVQVAADANFRGATFAHITDFDHAHISGSGLFGAEKGEKAAVFHGDARFTSAEFGGDADFGDVRFERDASFGSAHIAGKAVFGARNNNGAPLSDFKGPADFTAVRFGGDAEFAATSFEGKAIFDHAEIAGHGQFSKALFSRRSPASFNGLHFHEEAWFDHVSFGAPADFSNAQFDLDASFTDTHFGDEANFSQAHFVGPADFGGKSSGDVNMHPGARFAGKVIFAHAQFDNDAEFYDAVFKPGDNAPGMKNNANQPAALDFRGTTFKSIFLRGAGADSRTNQFNDATVDLRGCTYQRLEGDWRSLFRRGSDSRINPYDRQPYVQLEEVFRKTGNDEEADNVYLERREVERRQERTHRQFVSWLGDTLYGWFAKYGVDSSHLSVVAAFCLLGGMLIFSRPGAVSPRNKQAETAGTQTSLSVWEALKVSIHYFTPVDIPMGSEWVPSERPIRLQFGKHSLRLKVNPSTYAAVFLTLAGWVLVPLGIAALTGLLRRGGP